jgi:hypothetical protein
MGMGPLEQFRSLAETVKGGVIDNCGHWVIEEQKNNLANFWKALKNSSASNRISNQVAVTL